MLEERLSVVTKNVRIAVFGKLVGPVATDEHVTDCLGSGLPRGSRWRHFAVIARAWLRNKSHKGNLFRKNTRAD